MRLTGGPRRQNSVSSAPRRSILFGQPDSVARREKCDSNHLIVKWDGNKKIKKKSKKKIDKKKSEGNVSGV